ncbi:MAG: O-antigen ligase family protein [Bryobacterales bacterium]|nr:O-antigen ligase family protein [Bryobacterales bacterium]
MRFALPAYLTLAHLDLSALSHSAATHLGIENTIKLLGLPALLLLRMRKTPMNSCRWTTTFWILLTIYAGVAALWSPFFLPACKALGYLVGYALLFCLFWRAWNAGHLTPNGLLAALWIALILAMVQTYLTPGVLRNTEGRFTSFISPQSFAGFLLAFFIWLLFAQCRIRRRWIHLCAIIVGIFLSGSRYASLAAGIGALLAALMWLFRLSRVRGLSARVRGGIFALLAVAMLFQAYIARFPNNRFATIFGPDPYGRKVWERTGTWVWRLSIYREAAAALATRELRHQIFGLGTGSSISFLLTYNPRVPLERIDANRIMHNEFLRAAYEWGLIGVSLVVGLSAALTLELFLCAIRGGGDAWAGIAILPGIFLALSVENILSASSTAGGVAYAMLLAYAFSGSGSLQRRLPVTQRRVSGFGYVPRHRLLPGGTRAFAN